MDNCTYGVRMAAEINEEQGTAKRRRCGVVHYAGVGWHTGPGQKGMADKSSHPAS